MKDKATCAGPNGAVYGLGFIGAAVYYIGAATTFWMGVLGFLKAIVWPAFLVYEALKFLAAGFGIEPYSLQEALVNILSQIQLKLHLTN